MVAENMMAIQDAEKRGKLIGRRMSDVAIFEMRANLRLTRNALVAAVQMIESGQRDKMLIDALKQAVMQANEIAGDA